MKMTVTVDGLSECLDALEELPKSLQKPAMLRVLTIAAEPVRAAAEALAPVKSGELAGSIVIASSYANNIGKAEYSAVMAKGGTRSEATAALKAARHAAKIASGRSSSAPIPFVWIGPTPGDDKDSAIKRLAQEFGSVKQRPHPYMRPAWDAHKEEMLALVAGGLMPEIQKSMARFTTSAAARAAKGK